MSKSAKKSKICFSQMEARLMKTIIDLCSIRTPFENVEENYLPSLDAIKVRNSVEEQHQLATILWGVYLKLVKALPIGFEIDLDSVLEALRLSLQANKQHLLAREALSAVFYLVECVGFPSSSITDRLYSLVNSTPDLPEKIRFGCLKRISNALSISSQAHELSQCFSDATKLLRDNSPIPNELAELLISIIQSSVALVKVPLILDLQKHVCMNLLLPNPSIEVVKILNALLSNNHEQIPLPIQVAQVFFSHNFANRSPQFRAEVEFGRRLSQIYVRPIKVYSSYLNLDVNQNQISPTTPTEANRTTEVVNLANNQLDVGKTICIEEEKVGGDVNKGDNTGTNAEILELDDEGRIINAGDMDNKEECTACVSRMEVDEELTQKTADELFQDFVDLS